MTKLLDDDLTHAYCPIVKMEKTTDGLMVWGQAAGTGLDLDLQRFDKAYLKRAVPDWFKWANVREQHKNIAAGVGKELEVSADGESYMLKALIIDPVTIKKVETGVLKGFSPGLKRGKVVKSAIAPNGLIVDGEMVEISLVDRPSDPVNKISICKAAGGGTLAPVDSDGNELELEGPLVKWLTPDMYKSAALTVDDVLSGDYEGADIEDATYAIQTAADKLIAEAMMLKSADLSKPYDIEPLVSAVNALEMFLDPDASDDLEIRKSASIDDADTADLVKAAVAEATKGFRAQVEALTEEVARVKAMPIPGGPVLVARTPTPELTKSSRADHLRTQAQTPGLDPALARLYAQAASGEEAATS